MPRPMGPTVPRWQLGEQLSSLRARAEFTQQDAAKRLGCSLSKVQKIEAGGVSMNKTELEALLRYFDVPEGEWQPYLELQQLGKKRGWWSRYSKLPTPFVEFLGIESAAIEICGFEPMVISGLLQTEAYARAHETAVTPGQSEEQVDHQVQLRLERQKRILAADERPDIWIVFDEAAVRRSVGGPVVMEEQLRHVIELANQRIITVQVVPFSVGGYPGALGGFYVYSFDEDLHSPIAYVECQAGNMYMEQADDLRRCTVALNRIRATALNPEESIELLDDVASSMRHDKE